ncbi:MAG: hypothetical protein EOP51_04490 [Sphingobacteriales bacterium]|nr:MAG: hypothetical protein EOP51_04490 [Sphingobacteriales bacterium]
MNKLNIRYIYLLVILLLPFSSFAKIGLDINGGALIHKQRVNDYGTIRDVTSMGGAVAAKVTYQSKFFEVGPYAEYGGMQKSSYLLFGGTANVLIPVTDFQVYAGVTGGMANIGGEGGSSIGGQIGARYPIFSNLHFNTEVSFRHVSVNSLPDFNALGIMAGFHVKF